jgi:galactokinase
MTLDLDRLCDDYKGITGVAPLWAARAPGRVNLIGEHIDYNGGKVLPFAIDRSISAVAAPSADGGFHLHSADYKETFSWIDPLPEGPLVPSWANYFVAVLEEFHRRDLRVPPLTVLIEGDIPQGAGLSSSAAFEVCAASLLLAVLEEELPESEIALLTQAAEHGPRVGVQCGIMDQFISVAGKEGNALLLDCATLEYEPVSMPSEEVRVVVIHSTVERKLSASAYNQRRKQCGQGLEDLRRLTGKKAAHLVDFSWEEFETHETSLERTVSRRVRHVLTENLRVLQTVERLKGGDFAEVGQLLNASHASLRDDYEVSCPELDLVQETALSTEGVLGCRMTGGGFGGCAVALVESRKIERVLDSIQAGLAKSFTNPPWFFATHAKRGAESFHLG